MAKDKFNGYTKTEKCKVCADRHGYILTSDKQLLHALKLYWLREFWRDYINPTYLRCQFCGSIGYVNNYLEGVPCVCNDCGLANMHSVYATDEEALEIWVEVDLPRIKQ